MKCNLEFDVAINGEWFYTEYSDNIISDTPFDALVNIVNAFEDFMNGMGDELNIRINKFEEQDEEVMIDDEESHD